MTKKQNSEIHDQWQTKAWKKVANTYARFMRQNNLNEESGLPIGSVKETSYLKELDSNRKVKEKSTRIKQNKVNRFYGTEPKQ